MPSMPVEVIREYMENPSAFSFHGSANLDDSTLELFDSGGDAFTRGGVTASLDEAISYSKETRPSGAIRPATAEPRILVFRNADLPARAQRQLRVDGIVEELYPGGLDFDAPTVRPVGWFPAELGKFPEIVQPAATKGRAVGDKGLLQIWEKSVGTLRAGMPNDVVDRARALVDHTIALRHTKVPKAVLDRQLKLRGHLWEPLVEATARAQDDILELVAEAKATGSAELERAAEMMRSFQDSLERLNRLGDDLNYEPRAGFSDLVPLGEIAPKLQDVQRTANNALDAIEKAALEDPDFLLGLSLPLKNAKPGTIKRWVAAQRKKVNSWQPIEVAVPNKDQFVRLDTVGVGGVFEGQVGERTTALLLENMAGHLAALNTSAGMRAMAENVRGFEKWWRAAVTVGRPTFVPRNIIGGVFNGTIIGVGPRHYAYTAQNIMPALRRIRNGTSTWADEIASAKKGVGGYLQGLESSGVLGTSFSGTSLQHLKAPTRLRTKLNPASSQNAVFQAGGRFMETSEDFLRAAAFIANYNPAKPATALTAKALTLVAHFDYNDLTSLERSIKRFAPFFTWTRNNVPLQLRTMFERPGIYTKYRHFTANLEAQFGVDEDQAGNKYRSGIAASVGNLFSLGEGSEFWANAVFDPDLPFRDVEELLNSVDEDGPFGVLDWAIQSLSPVLTAPVDLAGSQDYQVVAPTGLAGILRFFDSITPGQLTEPALDGSILVSPRTRDIGNLLLPFLNEYTELAGVAPSSAAARSQLGYDATDGISTPESFRASGLRLLRSIGLGMDTPEDQYSASNDAIYRTIDEIIDRAYRSGDAVRADDLDALIAAIAKKQGVLVP